MRPVRQKRSIHDPKHRAPDGRSFFISVKGVFKSLSWDRASNFSRLTLRVVSKTIRENTPKADPTIDLVRDWPIGQTVEEKDR